MSRVIEYPDLSQAKEIAIDLETKDPNIKTKGAGWATFDGHIVGFAVAALDQQWYFPIHHDAGGNMDSSNYYCLDARYFKNTSN